MSWRRLARSPALWGLALICAACIVGPLLLGVDAEAIDLSARLIPPGPGHLLGTDENGRDVLARLLVGGRVSLFVGFGAGLVAGVLGAAVGLTAGWVGGLVSAVLMRLTDFAFAFPTIFVLLLAATLVGGGVPQLTILVGLTLWMTIGRVVRGRVLELRQAPFVEAAAALGASPWRLVGRHVLPNLQETLAVAVVLAIHHAILSESTVSFLGLGLRPPLASWGTMLANSQAYLATSPWLAVAPGLAIAFTVLATYAVAQSLSLPQETASRFRGP